MRRTVLLTALLALPAWPAGAALAAGVPAPCAIDLSTGTTSGFPNAPGTIDPDWSVNFTPTSGAGPAYSVVPAGGWASSTVATWIDPHNTGGLANDPNGFSEYEITFQLNVALMTNPLLSIDVAADDGADFFLNGNYIGSKNGFSTTSNLSTSSFFVNGLNVLRANTTNGPTNGPTGLLVEGGVTYEVPSAADCNGNGVPDFCEGATDCNQNGIPDGCEDGADCDNNGILDECEVFVDCNLDGIPDVCQIAGNDCNGNGVLDECESQADCNDNGVLDICEFFIDCNQNGIPDECEPDCDRDGVPDVCDLAGNDCNLNGVPDDCEGLADCDGNGVPDVCEIFPDCNQNGIPDPCDEDCNQNGIPDDCEGGPCPACRIDVSTGTTVPFVADAFGAQDPDWLVIWTPQFPGPAPAFSIAPAPGWVTHPNANWIDPFATAGGGPADPTGDYRYELTFTLNTATCTDVVLSADIAADDEAVVISLNGTNVGTLPGPGPAALTTVTLTNPALFVNGTNTFTIDVIENANWTGLLVAGDVTWREKIDVSTGTTNGAANPPGTLDPDWTVNSTPIGGPGPAFSITPAPVMAPTATGTWIDPFGTGGTTPDPGGDYDYETTFALDFSCVTDFRLDVDLAGDDAVELFLNGTSVGGSALISVTTPVSVTNQLLFVPGVNTLSARVANDPASPTGLLVEGCVTTACGPTACRDCDGDGIDDGLEVANGTLTDTNGDGVPDQCQCPADFDGNGAVGFADLSAMLQHWGPCLPGPCPWDLIGDGSVGFADLSALLAAWGPC